MGGVLVELLVVPEIVRDFFQQRMEGGIQGPEFVDVVSGIRAAGVDLEIDERIERPVKRSPDSSGNMVYHDNEDQSDERHQADTISSVSLGDIVTAKEQMSQNDAEILSLWLMEK